MINNFEGKYLFLSNFYAKPFYSDTLECEVKSGEHMFQALKCTNDDMIAQVLLAATPGEAKKVGRRVIVWDNWETGLRVASMERVLTEKFSEGSVLADRLVNTGKVRLVEGNHWHDNFWGDCTECRRNACLNPGVNMLGELLMARREELRNT